MQNTIRNEISANLYICYAFSVKKLRLHQKFKPPSIMQSQKGKAA